MAGPSPRFAEVPCQRDPTKRQTSPDPNMECSLRPDVLTHGERDFTHGRAYLGCGLYGLRRLGHARP